MATKTKEKNHVGFRNGDLFCFNCGTSYKMNLPQPATMASAMMIQFDKDHKNCKPTWKEPITTTNGKTEEENANWWAINGEHGISSKTMFNYLVKGLNVRTLPNSFGQCTPSDPDDFKRCYKLIKAVPQWKERLHELKVLSPVWSRLVDNWDKLTGMYEQNVREDWKNYKKVGMYEFMKSLGC
jgi:hypothetical protein